MPYQSLSSNYNFELNTVPTPVIPATWEAEIGRIFIQGQPRQKVSKTPSQQVSWTWWYTTMNPSMLEVVDGKIAVLGQPCQKF
jgi:hypothetical protein